MRAERNSGTAAIGEDQQLCPSTRSKQQTSRRFVDTANRSTRRTVKRTLLTLKRWYGKIHRRAEIGNERDVIECHCQNRINESKLTGETSPKSTEDVKDAWDFANENLENELRELRGNLSATFGEECRASFVGDMSL